MFRAYFIKSISTGKYFLGCSGSKSALEGNYDPVAVNLKVGSKYGKHKKLLELHSKNGRKDFVFKFTKAFKTEFEALMYCHESYCKLVLVGMELNDSFSKPQMMECDYCGKEFLTKYQIDHNKSCEKIIDDAEDGLDAIIE